MIAADDDVAALRVSEELAQPGAREEIVAGAPVVDVVRARLIGEVQARDQLVAAADWTSRLNCCLPSSFFERRRYVRTVIGDLPPAPAR
jgi:hypothetical protein